MTDEVNSTAAGAEIASGYDKLYTDWLSDPKRYGNLMNPDKHYGHGKHCQYLLNLLGVKEDKNKKLLDVACGAGGFLYFADKRASCTGMDISRLAVKYASRIVPGASVMVCEAEALPYRDGEFDYVSCIGSLEHLMDMDKGLREMKRVLKDDGRLIIEVPNAFAIASIGLAIIEADKGTDSELQPIGRSGTRWGWHQLLERNGLKPLKVSTYNWRTHPLEFLRPELSVRGLLRHALRLTSPLIPKNLSENFVYVAGKAR